MTIEAIVIRDPDAATELYVVVDGTVVEVTEYHIDPGSGWTRDEWCAHRDKMLSTASPAAQAILRDRMNDPPGGQYISDQDERPWL
ncbi:hypothetical protein [Rhodococcus pyridinivorans]|uniref:hypothetical protein n=1 Tax=Rhodococcus pyridinivorans TaxID=103816 RepID=UPI0026592F84|nr:hypothetical protein [Rhodococcus pyridinivorans]